MDWSKHDEQELELFLTRARRYRADCRTQADIDATERTIHELNVALTQRRKQRAVSSSV